MIEQIMRLFLREHDDREIERIELVHKMGVDGVYVISAPKKDTDNSYEPCDFLFSLKSGKSVLLVPTEDIDSYTKIMSHLEPIWERS